MRTFATCLLFLAVASMGTVAVADEAADKEFTFAYRLLERNEDKLSRETFQKFVQKFPNDPRVPDAQYYMAVLARRGGEPSRALDHIDRAVGAKFISASAVHLLGGQIKLENGKPGDAIAQLEKVQEADLKDAQTKALWQYLRGAAYRGAGNPTAAATAFAASAALESTIRGSALLELGKARIELKQFDEAAKALDEAMNHKHAPEAAAEARYLAGDTFYGLQQYPRAAEYYQQVVQQHQASKFFAPAIVGHLRALFALGDFDKVVTQFDASETHIPRELRADALYLVGVSLVQQKQYVKGGNRFVELYRLTSGQHPMAREIAYNYAICVYHTNLEEFENWVARLESASELENVPQADELRFLRAQAAVTRNKLADAATYLKPLIEKDSGEYAKRALLQRAALYEKLNQPAMAAADYALFMQKYPTDSQSIVAGRRAIDLAFRAGDFDRVVKEAGPLLQREGLSGEQSQQIRLQLALSLLKLERRGEALQALTELLAQKPTAEIAAQSYYWQGVLLAANTPGDQAAIDALENALKGSLPEQQRVAALALIARQHHAAGRIDSAVAAYERLRALKPPEEFDPSVAAWVGSELLATGRDAAAEQWLVSVTKHPQATEGVLAQAQFLLGESLRKQGKNSEAIQRYEQVLLTRNAYMFRARLGMAMAFESQGQTDEALKQYSQLLTVEVSAVAAEALLRSSLLHMQRANAVEPTDANAAAEHRKEARLRLNRLIILHDVPELDDFVGRAMLALGSLDSIAGDTAKARSQFQAIVSRPNRSPWHRAAEAEIAVLGGDIGQAAALLRKMHQESTDPKLKEHAEKRLKDLGEKP